MGFCLEPFRRSSNASEVLLQTLSSKVDNRGQDHGWAVLLSCVRVVDARSVGGATGRESRLLQPLIGVEPPEQPQVAQETLEGNGARHARIRAGLEQLREVLATNRPDALIVVGDDQNENFTEENLPQFAIYSGATVRGCAFGKDTGDYPCHADLADAILEGCVDRGVDLWFGRRFPNNQLKFHAHVPPLDVLLPKRDIPIVPIFVNARHPPRPEPARCYALGQAIRRVIEVRPENERVAIYASGGLSHFTAGYPWKRYKGPHRYGANCTEFDEHILELMHKGEGHRLAALTSKDLLDNGDIELRSWIILLGALSATPATSLVYEPSYRGIMGMGVGYWDMSNGQQ